MFDQIEGNGKQNDFTDFYKNLCLVKEIESGYSAASNVPKHLLQNAKPFLREQEAQRRAPELPAKVAASGVTSKTSGGAKSKADATLTVSSSGKLPGPMVQIAADAVHTICNYEGIKIRNNEPFSGVMFVKNKYDTCRVEVAESDSATLLIGLPENFGSNLIPDGTDSSTIATAASSQHSTTADKQAKTTDELRVRRQAAGDLLRDCGIQDLVCFIAT
ncbi:unnamed protein product [Gongylonema pulchrum]|uniref:Uncharacterized protein n=1 Tax=Gongylonema pulchrum TaxID=637853 RepID=A0A3P6RAN3_9BILA|nr:unnamed protein product [Gongylonema pulchrum]